MGGEELALRWYGAEVTGSSSRTEACVSDGSTDSDKKQAKKQGHLEVRPKIRETWYHLLLWQS